MHVRELVELGALVALQGSLLVRGPRPLAAAGMEQYWVASKCRLERWTRSLRRLAGVVAGAPLGVTAVSIRPVLEEILASELVTRVWAAAAAAHDQVQGQEEMLPLARNIYVGHQEARRRSLMLLVRSADLHLAEGAQLNRLRRTIERWTDHLLSRLAEVVDIAPWAFEPERALDFARDQAETRDGHLGESLILGGLRTSLARGLSPISPNADLNQQLAGGVLACLPADLFALDALPHSLWLKRLHRMADDAQALLDECLALDAIDSPPPNCSAG